MVQTRYNSQQMKNLAMKLSAKRMQYNTAVKSAYSSNDQINESRTNQMKHTLERNQLLKIVKFEVILLSYMFYNDDMKLSKDEIKHMKSFIMLSVPKITKPELKDLLSVIKLRPSYGDILRLKEAYKFTNEGVQLLIDEIKDVSQIEAYQDLLAKLQSYFN